MMQEMYSWYLTLDFENPNEGLSEVVPVVLKDIQKFDKKRVRTHLYKGQTGSVRAFREAEAVRSETDAMLRTVTTAMTKGMRRTGVLSPFAWIPTAIGGVLPVAGGMAADYAHSGVMDIVEQYGMSDTEAYDLEVTTQSFIRHLWF